MYIFFKEIKKIVLEYNMVSIENKLKLKYSKRDDLFDFDTIY